MIHTDGRPTIADPRSEPIIHGMSLKAQAYDQAKQERLLSEADTHSVRVPEEWDGKPGTTRQLLREPHFTLVGEHVVERKIVVEVISKSLDVLIEEISSAIVNGKLVDAEQVLGVLMLVRESYESEA